MTNNYALLINAVRSNARARRELSKSTLNLAIRAATSSQEPTEAQIEAVRVVYNVAAQNALISKTVARKLRTELIAVMIEQGFRPCIGRAVGKNDLPTLFRF